MIFFFVEKKRTGFDFVNVNVEIERRVISPETHCFVSNVDFDILFCFIMTSQYIQWENK